MNKIIEKSDKQQVDNNSFYLNQLSEIGLSGPDDPCNIVHVSDPFAEPPAPRVVKMHIFAPTPSGDLQINFADLDGARYVIDDPSRKNRKPLYYHQLRHQAPGSGPKYTGPKNMGTFPFIPPQVRELFQKGEKCETLVITEGAKKSMRAAIAGIPTIGLASITTSIDKETGALHGDIIRFIEVCQVKNVVIFFDSDSTDIAKNPLQGEDLVKRPTLFFSQVNKIRDQVLRISPNVQVFFSHPTAAQIGKPKGLDDLLNDADAAGALDACKAEVVSINPVYPQFVYKANITAGIKNLESYFAIGKNDVEAFYARHRAKIGEGPFVFKGKSYRFNETGRVSLVDEKEGPQNPFIQTRDFLLKRYMFRRNVINNDVELCKNGETTWEPAVVADLLTELWEAGFRTDEKKVTTFLCARKYVPEHDPFLDYFNNLPAWDGLDHIQALANFVQTPDRDFFNIQFKKAVVRTVAQALGRIPFNKHCIILQSEGQHTGKTSFIRFLVPPALSEYVTDHLDLQNKDGRFALCQNFIVNLDELSQFKPDELRKVKSMLALGTVKERPIYEKRAVGFARRASAWGSTDKAEFLVDSTGNVRWVVLRVTKINHDNGGQDGYAQGIDIDKVYAQALHLLNSNFVFRLTDDDLKHSEANNQNFIVTSSEMEWMQSLWAPAGGKDDRIKMRVTRDGRVVEQEFSPKFHQFKDVLKALEAEGMRNPARYAVTAAANFLGWKKGKCYLPGLGQSRDGYWLFELKEAEGGEAEELPF